MKKGIRIPAAVVRLTAAALGAALVATAVAQAPGAMRYARMKSM